MPINCRKYQESKLLSQCKQGELILFDFHGSNVLAIIGTIEENAAPILILKEVGRKIQWTDLPFFTHIDSAEEGCISYGTDWVIDTIPSLFDTIVKTGYREAAGTLLLGENTVYIMAHMPVNGWPSSFEHLDLDNLRMQNSIKGLRSTCKHWRIWLSSEEMETGTKEPIFEFCHSSNTESGEAE